MSWLSDCNAIGKTMTHMDGGKGLVLSIDGGYATIAWEDGMVSTEHEDFLSFVDIRP